MLLSRKDEFKVKKHDYHPFHQTPWVDLFFEEGNICISIKQELKHPKKGVRLRSLQKQQKDTKKKLSKYLYLKHCQLSQLNHPIHP